MARTSKDFGSSADGVIADGVRRGHTVARMHETLAARGVKISPATIDRKARALRGHVKARSGSKRAPNALKPAPKSTETSAVKAMIAALPEITRRGDELFDRLVADGADEATLQALVDLVGQEHGALTLKRFVELEAQEKAARA